MLLGRDAECGRIARLLDDARGGASGTLVIRGEAGIGKSALLGFAVESAAGLTVLRARGVESEAELAFSGLYDLFRPVLGRLDAIPAPQAAALAGALALGPPAGADRFTVCAATLSLLASAAEDAPVLAAVDDAHWLDPSSREALLFAARRLEAEGVALLVAVRDGSSEPFERAGVPLLALEGLAPDAAAGLLELTAGVAVAAAVAELLCAAVAGNPLALVELAGLLSAAQLGGEDLLPDPLPAAPSLERAFQERIAELPPEAQTALALVAASESGAWDSVAGALDDLGLGAEALEPAERAGLVETEDGRIAFRHPLVRSAAYRAAPSAVRQAVHRSLARAATGELAHDRRAWHLAAAALTPDPSAASALEQAALNARSRGGHSEAAGAFERAAELTENGEERARLLLEAGDEARLAGELERTLTLLGEAAGASADPLTRARIEHMRGVIDMWRGAPMAAHDRLAAEAERIEPADPDRAARMLTDAAWACFMAGEVTAGTEVARRAYETGERVGGLAEILATTLYGIGLLLSGRAADASPFLWRHEALLEESGFLERNYHLIRPAGQVLIWVEDFVRARRLFTRVIEAARAYSAPSMLPYALAGLAELEFRTGAWPAAYANASEAARLASETQQDAARAFALVTLARVEAAQGREEDCRVHVRQALELAAFGVGSVLGYAGSALGLLELGLGRHAEAIDHLEVLARRVREHGLGEPGVIQWAPDLVEAYVRSGRTEEAERTLEEFETSARETGRAWALSAAARCRGLLASDAEIDGLFAEALRQHAGAPMPFEQARTQLCLGERLRRARRRSEAREPLRAALETFERLGAGAWAERARSEVRASGETIRRGAAALTQELTPQELQVALVVAQGATNREAGAALFLSPKTIEAHLGRIYRKLEVRSRTELATRLAGEGVLEVAAAGVS